MLELRSVSKTFGTNKAVDEVSLNIEAGAMVGIIGRSGAGKSTLLRLINRLCDLSSGEILWRGMPVSRLHGEALSEWRACCGMVFQQFNLSPRLDVLTNVLTGSLYRNKGIPALFKAFPQSERARAILELDSLDMAHAAMQRCCTLSGGQQQRVAIARALAANPDFIVCDEPTSALDVSVQAQILNLMKDLQKEFGLTYVFISHNLQVVRHMATDIGVLYLGRLAEVAPAATLFAAPRHPYTRMLLDAVPDIDMTGRRRKKVEGEIPSPIDPPPGCPFHPRCPLANDRCRVEVPALLDGVACHAVHEGRG